MWPAPRKRSFGRELVGERERAGLYDDPARQIGGDDRGDCLRERRRMRQAGDDHRSCRAQRAPTSAASSTPALRATRRRRRIDIKADDPKARVHQVLGERAAHDAESHDADCLLAVAHAVPSDCRSTRVPRGRNPPSIARTHSPIAFQFHGHSAVGSLPRRAQIAYRLRHRGEEQCRSHSLKPAPSLMSRSRRDANSICARSWSPCWTPADISSPTSARTDRPSCDSKSRRAKPMRALGMGFGSRGLFERAQKNPMFITTLGMVSEAGSWRCRAAC